MTKTHTTTTHARSGWQSSSRNRRRERPRFRHSLEVRHRDGSTRQCGVATSLARRDEHHAALARRAPLSVTHAPTSREIDRGSIPASTGSVERVRVTGGRHA